MVGGEVRTIITNILVMKGKKMKEHKFPYEWKISDGYPAKGIEYNGLKVFSCFACGGGSTMGYKLAGYEVLGCNEIDPRMNECYVANHNPKYNFLEPIQEFKLRDDIPAELYELDILDGSPPCSSFSMAGNREKNWGEKKKFREGQQEQVLDTLFFDFLEVAKKLQPKVVIAENVKGLLQGGARKYLKGIGDAFRDAGYRFSYKLLDASEMGVPQRRERVFFYGIREDLEEHIEYEDMFQELPHLELEFSEPKIIFEKVREVGNYQHNLSSFYKELWEQRISTDVDFSSINGRVRDKPNTGFGTTFVKPHRVCGTLTAKKDCYCDFEDGRYLSDSEKKKIGSYPMDYDFCESEPHYLIGMSVPPVMTAQIAHRIYEQWFSKINE